MGDFHIIVCTYHTHPFLTSYKPPSLLPYVTLAYHTNKNSNFCTCTCTYIVMHIVPREDIDNKVEVTMELYIMGHFIFV